MKKMRKLIPALSMLLIATIMLSTATFAWFTMNESVTATGMEIKAKAAGNLLISKTTLTAIDQDITVKFDDVAKKDLTPTDLVQIPNPDYDAEEAETLGEAYTVPATIPAWVKPASGKDVDPTFGTYTGNMDTITPSGIGSGAATDKYFAEYTVYIATAGDQMTADLYLDLSALAGVDPRSK
jgi:hypothetical protein